MSSSTSRVLVVALACGIAAGAACSKKKESKPNALATQDASTAKRMSPKAKAASDALAWDASVQKMEEMIREAEAKGDTAAADDFRRKLKVSQDGAAQARRKLEAIEAAEARARQQ